jgi:hypothetical protein
MKTFNHTRIINMRSCRENEITCNKEVKACDRKQQEIMKTFNHTRIINMRSCREKECITNKTAEIIKKFHKSEVGSYES